MWVTRNLYRSDFSLRLRRRGFGMASRQRSPNSFTRGLWSTATMRSATKGEMTSFIECVDDSKSFTLYGCVTGFSSRGKSASDECDSPAYLAAEWRCGRAGAMLLK